MIDINRAFQIEGWMEADELEQIAKWSSTHNHILELGPWKGRSTRAICDNTNGTVITVDHWQGASSKIYGGYEEVETKGSDYCYHVFRGNLQDHIDSGRLRPIKNEIHSTLLMLLKEFGFSYFDMIFIDAGHESYEIYKRNLIYSLPLLAENGLICGHDYTYPGAQQALNEILCGYSHGRNIWWRKSW